MKPKSALCFRLLQVLLLGGLLAGCTSFGNFPDFDPLAVNEQLLDEAGGYQGDERYIGLLHQSRTWVRAKSIDGDVIEFGKRAQIPIQAADAKLLGPIHEDARRSLGLKIWMIENAEHTLDVVYYIFKNDLVGQAMLGALCNAVQRGVDVRLMVDAAGSFSFNHHSMRKLHNCALNAGYMRTAQNEITPYRARVQTVVFNALSNASSWANRRSHDKLLVKDGAFPGKALVITGGRNVSLDYYAMKDDGSLDPEAYSDLEILIKDPPDIDYGTIGVGNISEIYYSLLFLHKGNKALMPLYEAQVAGSVLYESEIKSLAKLKSYPEMQQFMQDMPAYLNTDFRRSQVRLAHELGNLTDRYVTRQALENLTDNENSITNLIRRMGYEKPTEGVLRIVSPYMFMAKYYNEDGEVVQDDAAVLLEWLDEHPGRRLEIVTNSVLTSDNFMAQSIVDMDMSPRLVLPDELAASWLSTSSKDETLVEANDSEHWQRLVSDPRVQIYQTGKLDSANLGLGKDYYGKLHAKFILGDDIGFVGTTNFDYRSRLYNNELGFFCQSAELHQDLVDIFELLKSESYRWGSPEWFEMRQQVMDASGMKGWSTRHQRGIYKFLYATGLDWWM